MARNVEEVEVKNKNQTHLWVVSTKTSIEVSTVTKWILTRMSGRR